LPETLSAATNTTISIITNKRVDDGKYLVAHYSLQVLFEEEVVVVHLELDENFQVSVPQVHVVLQEDLDRGFYRSIGYFGDSQYPSSCQTFPSYTIYSISGCLFLC
jgi:hypothetical protein